MQSWTEIATTLTGGRPMHRTPHTHSEVLALLYARRCVVPHPYQRRLCARILEGREARKQWETGAIWTEEMC